MEKIYNYTNRTIKAMDEDSNQIPVIKVESNKIIHIDGICVVDSSEKVGKKMIQIDKATNYNGVIIYDPEKIDCSVEDLLEILC